MRIKIKRLPGRRVKVLAAMGAAAALAASTVVAASLATAPEAQAAGTYCYVNGGCNLYATPNLGTFYFEAGGKLPAGMLCWEDGQWTDLGYSTNRWFKMTSAAYGIFWAPASEVINQISTPPC